MKKSIIREIFHGNRGNLETMQIPNVRNNANTNAVSDIYDELKEKLSPEQLQLHQKFVDTLEKVLSAESDFFVVEAFKLGLLVGIECMEE